MESVTEPSAAGYSPTSTPILDVLRPLPHGERWKLSAGEIFFLSSSFIFSLIIAQAIGPLAVDIVEPAALSAVLLAGAGLFILAVVIHESGHFIVALLAGFRPALKDDEGLGQKLYGSEVMCFGFLPFHPTRIERLSYRLFLVCAAGPLASLLVPVIVENISFAQPAWLSNCLHFFSACSVLLGMSSLLPDLSRSGKFSDGGRMLTLLKKDAPAERWLCILRIQFAWRQGNTPQLWPDLWIEALTASDDASRDAIHGKWLAYLWATEQQDTTRATAYLEAALARPVLLRGGMRRRIFLEAAIFQAWFRENPELARFWAARFGSGDLDLWQRQRLEVALQWADGQLFDAQEKLASFLADLEELPPSPKRSLMESGAREWKRQMQSRMLTRAWRNIYSMSQQVESAADALPVGR